MFKKLKPGAPGLLVRNHANKMRPLPEDGEMVQIDATWIKRMRDGDAVEVTEPKPVIKAAKPTKTETKAEADN